MTDPSALLPVIATVTVPADPATAFAVFTRSMGSWWPVLQQSLGGSRVVDVEVPGHVGGSVVEVWDDGTRKAWAEVLVLEPPHRITLAWNPTENPDERVPSTVDVTFAGTDDGTLVTLTHTGWEAWGEEARASYAEGWPGVLATFRLCVEG